MSVWRLMEDKQIVMAAFWNVLAESAKRGGSIIVLHHIRTHSVHPTGTVPFSHPPTTCLLLFFVPNGYVSFYNSKFHG